MAKAMKMMTGGTCPCPHHRWVPIGGGVLVTLFGIAAIAKVMGNISQNTFDWTWSVLALLFGLGWLAKAMCPCCMSYHKMM
jgi:hypothetical protein